MRQIVSENLKRRNEMTELEATRIKLKCLEMVERTSVKWWECLKLHTGNFVLPPTFNGHEDEYQVALGILEGKPVFADDKVWSPNGTKLKAGSIDVDILLASTSWNPPKLTPVSQTMLGERLLELRKEAINGGMLPLTADEINSSLSRDADMQTWTPIPVRATYAQHKREHEELMSIRDGEFFDAKKWEAENMYVTCYDVRVGSGPSNIMFNARIEGK